MDTTDFNEIDTTAPVHATSEIIIDSPPEAIWKILTTFNDWPTWNPDIKSITFSGDLKKGSVFSWKTGSFKITSTIQNVDAPNQISWTGKMIGVDAIHVWQIIPMDNKTLIRTSESWEGFLVHIFKKPMQKMLQESLEKGLRYIKSAAESKA